MRLHDPLPLRRDRKFGRQRPEAFDPGYSTRCLVNGETQSVFVEWSCGDNPKPDKVLRADTGYFVSLPNNVKCPCRDLTMRMMWLEETQENVCVCEDRYLQAARTVNGIAADRFVG